jgi:hypothetical protein
VAAHSRKSAADGEAPSVRNEAKEFGLGRSGVISLAPTGHNCSFFKPSRFLKMSRELGFPFALDRFPLRRYFSVPVQAVRASCVPFAFVT